MTDTGTLIDKVYHWRFATRNYELDPRGVVKPTVLQGYIQEGAMKASAAFGYDYDWYMGHKQVWVARKLTLRYYADALYGDQLEMRTWISDARRVQSHREYDLRRVRDGASILRARTNWVYVDLESMRPVRFPDEFLEALIPGDLEEIDSKVHDPVQIEDPVIHNEERRVQYYELDSLNHVNNAYYVAWIDEAIDNALRKAEWSPERFTAQGVTMSPLAHEVEYLRGARAYEPIWITTRLSQIGRDRASWYTEILQAETNELIAKDVAVRRFADTQGARSIPDSLHLALIQRP